MKHKQCSKCVYRVEWNSGLFKRFCNYSLVEKKTCLTIDEATGKTIDRRGTDPNNCNLFIEGKKRCADCEEMPPINYRAFINE